MSKQFKDPYRSFLSSSSFQKPYIEQYAVRKPLLIKQETEWMILLYFTFSQEVFILERERGSIRIFAENEIRNECKSYIYCYLQLKVSTPKSPWILSTVEKTKQNKTKGRVILNISLKWQPLATYWPLLEREDCKKALWLGRRILIHLHFIIATVPLYLSPSC